MARRVKEDEKNEKIIRGLLKLPANRRCINCNSPSTASLTSRGSNFGISAEPKLVNSGNLIDFDADPIVPVARALDQYVPQQTASSPAESGGWASFDDSSALKVTQVASAVSTPASLLSQLSVPQTASAANAPSIPIARVGSSPTQSNAGHWPTMHQHQPFVFLGPSVQTMNKPLHETTAGVSTQPPATEAKPTGRKELPVFPNLASLHGALPYADGHSTIWHSTSNLPMQQWLPPPQISMRAVHGNIMIL
ncbi:hypothetical protein BHM03_00013916 [Ensete ventricosum]|nr:hypothetical protein BHM03_00013916 [Ensete ventricosum]